MMHVLDQPQMRAGDGPIGLILAPTRELAQQIVKEAQLFAWVYKIRVCCVFGGAGKWEMTKALNEAPEIVVATPGRLIEMVRIKATSLERCTMVVLDEADRMFDMGFEYQMRSIVNNIRPDRQTLLFSATMKHKIESFAREILTNPVRVVVGTVGQANPDITQVVEVFPRDDDKWAWLAANADSFVADGKVLVFVSGKADTERVTKQLQAHFVTRMLDIGVDCLHGDRDQSDRMNVMRRFSRSASTLPISSSALSNKSNSTITILVATDIASRGLDIKDIRTVVNFDTPKNIETYIHRIGRTGRMGVQGVTPGVAYTLMLSGQDGAFAGDLVHNLRISKQDVPAQLLHLAQSNPRFSNHRQERSGGGRGGGGVGIGFGGANQPRAMTSAALASGTTSGGLLRSVHQPSTFLSEFSSPVLSGQNKSAEVVSYIGNESANPYRDGKSLGRGKHLTQPSWAVPSNSIASTNTDPIAAPIRARPSRFSDNPPTTSSITGKLSAPPTVVSVPSGSTGSRLPGFVRSRDSLTSVDCEPVVVSSGQPHATIPKTKKSRWD